MHDDISSDVADIFADAGCAAWVHARSLAPAGPEFDYAADTPVVLASVYKAALLVSLHRLSDRGEIDLSETVRVDPRGSVAGPTGLALFTDPVTLSWRDLSTSMMTVSDNVAADVILGRVGLAQLADDLATLGLDRTRVIGGMREVHEQIRRDTGTRTVDEAFAALADPDIDGEVSAYDAAYSSAGTARDCTALLSSIWSDTAASPEACARIRATMRAQVFTSRIASGFPSRYVTVAGKTGSLAAIRNEIAVVEFTGEYPVAIAVFTKSARPDPALPEVDRAIGRAARLIVTGLRRPRDA